MLSCRVMPGVPAALVEYVARLLLAQRRRTLQHVMISPSQISGSAAALVLVQFEHKMIT